MLRKRVPISVIVLTHNEEVNIEACLDSVVEWADEIFIVDSGSTDATCAIAGRYPVKLSAHPFEDYGRQRNWAQTHLPISNDWIFHIDADERVTPELSQSIEAFFTSGLNRRVNGAMFARRTVFMGRWIRHGGHYPTFHTRLFRRDCGHCEDRLYDQHFIVNGPVVRLPGDLIDVLAPDLDSWMIKHVRWAEAEARQALRGAEGAAGQIPARLGRDPIARRRWLRNRLFSESPPFFRALLYFLYRYFIRGGFLDGTKGLIFHFLHAFWYRFYVDAKLFEAQQCRHAECDQEREQPSGGATAPVA